MAVPARRPEVVVPDAVRGPQPWPQPYEGADDPGDHDRAECDDMGGCAWCDQDRWRTLYSELWAAFDQLMHVARDAASALDGGCPEARQVGKHLRAKVGEAALRRTKLPPPSR